jgi:hypothetical protein
MLLGVGGTICNTHTSLSRTQVLILIDLRNLLLSSECILLIYHAAKLVHTRRALFNIVHSSHQELLLGQAHTTILILSLWWRKFTVPGTKVAHFP